MKEREEERKERMKGKEVQRGEIVAFKHTL